MYSERRYSELYTTPGGDFIVLIWLGLIEEHAGEVHRVLIGDYEFGMFSDPAAYDALVIRYEDEQWELSRPVVIPAGVDPYFWFLYNE